MYAFTHLFEEHQLQKGYHVYCDCWSHVIKVHLQLPQQSSHVAVLKVSISYLYKEEEFYILSLFKFKVFIAER